MIAWTKVQGNGNDFLVLDDREGRLGDGRLASLARSMCDRRTGLGADGLLIAAPPSAGAAHRMRILNSDGSEGEMCGNGARCFARWLYERGLAGSDFRFETLAGEIVARVDPPFAALDLAPVRLPRDAEGALRSESLDLLSDPATGPASAPFREELLRAAGGDGEDVPARLFSLRVGPPHAVLTGPDWRLLSRPALVALGRALRRDGERFPAGTNVNFAVPLDREEGRIFVVTYERGVEDLTDSCGTGSTASAIVSVLTRGYASPIAAENPGGENRVELAFREEREGRIALPRLIGRTALVAEGLWYEEEIEGRRR